MALSDQSDFERLRKAVEVRIAQAVAEGWPMAQDWLDWWRDLQAAFDEDDLAMTWRVTTLDVNRYEWRCDACGRQMENPPPIGRKLDPCPACGATRWLPIGQAASDDQETRP